MAVFKRLAPDEEPPGKWYPFAEDPDHGDTAEVYFVPMNPEVSTRLQEEYQETVPVRIKGKMKYELKIPDERQEEYWSAVVNYMWRRASKFRVPVDADSVSMFRKHIGKDTAGNEIVEGSEVQVDKNLHPEIKTWCIKHVPGLAAFVLNVISRLHDRDPGEGRVDSPEERREKALTQNLATGSPSGSGTESSPTTEPVAMSAPSSEEKTSPVSATSG